MIDTIPSATTVKLVPTYKMAAQMRGCSLQLTLNYIFLETSHGRVSRHTTERIQRCTSDLEEDQHDAKTTTESKSHVRKGGVPRQGGYNTRGFSYLMLEC